VPRVVVIRELHTVIGTFQVTTNDGSLGSVIALRHSIPHVCELPLVLTVITVLDTRRVAAAGYVVVVITSPGTCSGQTTVPTLLIERPLLASASALLGTCVNRTLSGVRATRHGIPLVHLRPLWSRSGRLPREVLQEKQLHEYEEFSK